MSGTLTKLLSNTFFLLSVPPLLQNWHPNRDHELKFKILRHPKKLTCKGERVCYFLSLRGVNQIKLYIDFNVWKTILFLLSAS